MRDLHQYNQHYYIAHKEVIKARQLRFNKDRKIEVFTHYGNQCVCCGEANLDFLTIDHINNDGEAFRRQFRKSGFTFYNWIVVNHFPLDLQLLCYNCNCSRGHQPDKKCPHTKLLTI